MSVEMQLQMRRNVEQMHETAADLESWLGDIGKRDNTLRGVAPTGGGSRGAKDEGTDEEEEAREIEEAKEQLRQLSLEQDARDASSSAPTKKSSKGAQTHAQKYGNWERYDAEGVVNAMEEREADTERLRKEVVRLENRRAQAKARKVAAAAAAAADALRLQGNEAFGAARYEEAVGLYTDALSHAPRSAVLYANRALALLKLHAYAEAEEDCDAALLLESGFVKALLRRAQARHAREDYDGALSDLEAALEKEPKNGGARSLMAECRRLKAASVPKPVPRLVPVAIETIQHDPDNDNDPFVNTLAPPPPPTAPTTAPSAADATATAAVAPESSAAAAAGGAPDKPAAAKMRALPGGAPSADSFGTPTSLAEMERAWRSLRGQPSEFATLVRRVEPAKLQALFKNNLPAELFSAILSAVETAFFPEHAARAVEVLRALTHAGRFSILTMCLDKADTRAIGAIFASLEAAHGRGELPADAELTALRKQYA